MRFHREKSGRCRTPALDHHAPAIRQRQPVQTVGQGIDTGTEKRIHAAIVVDSNDSSWERRDAAPTSILHRLG
jgi:hypothetical protein